MNQHGMISFIIISTIISFYLVIHYIQLYNITYYRYIPSYHCVYNTKFKIICNKKESIEWIMILLSFIPIINYLLICELIRNIYLLSYEYDKLFYDINKKINYDIKFKELLIVTIINKDIPLYIRKFKDLDSLLKFLRKKNKERYYEFEKTLFTTL